APNDVEVLRSLPPEKLGSGTALLGAARNLGMTFGVAMGATVLDYWMTNAHGSNAQRVAAGVKTAMAAGAISALLGAASAVCRPSGRAPKGVSLKETRRSSRA
ncbi:MAG TPA: hypothetical protein VGL13_04220, partial [Polyangiaceae bacterium]